jgi:hypothetical protein
MSKEYFLSAVLPVSLCIAGVLYLLVTGWLDHRAKQPVDKMPPLHGRHTMWAV